MPSLIGLGATRPGSSLLKTSLIHQVELIKREVKRFVSKSLADFISNLESKFSE